MQLLAEAHILWSILLPTRIGDGTSLLEIYSMQFFPSGSSFEIAILPPPVTLAPSIGDKTRYLELWQGKAFCFSATDGVAVPSSGNVATVEAAPLK